MACETLLLKSVHFLIQTPLCLVGLILQVSVQMHGLGVRITYISNNIVLLYDPSPIELLHGPFAGHSQ